MKQFTSFSEVSSRYGAPMGRREHGDTDNIQGLRRLYARHQGCGDGYDKGGAYWGTPSNVRGVWGWVDGQVCCTYVRADTRTAALDEVRRGID